jgi:membrane protein
LTRGGAGRAGTDIPAFGWKDIFWRVYNGISDDRISANAAGVTYYALLALFPGVAAVVSIYGLFADPSSILTMRGTGSTDEPGTQTSDCPNIGGKRWNKPPKIKYRSR